MPYRNILGINTANAWVGGPKNRAVPKIIVVRVNGALKYLKFFHLISVKWDHVNGPKDTISLD